MSRRSRQRRKQQCLREKTEVRKTKVTRQNCWKRIGGGSLSAAILIHLIALAAGAVWVFRTLYPPVPQADFLPSGRGGGSPHRSEATAVKASKRAAPPLPSLNPKRVFATGAASTFAMPPMEDDSFAGLSALSQLSQHSNRSAFGQGGSFGQRGGAPAQGAGGGMGAGFGGGAAKAILFFNQQVRAQNIAYVIDFSRTMKGKREKLMRDELSKSIAQLGPAQKFQLIFFSGPVWCAGDRVEMAEDKRHAVVTSGRNTFRWQPNGRPGGWEVDGKRPRPDWLSTHGDAIPTATRHIRETPLVYGTYWQPPLEIALSMEPAPHVVFFMTDGLTGANTQKVVEAISSKARAKKTVINTVAMMEPQAGKSLRDLAHATGGQFSMIEPDGTVVLEPAAQP